MNPIKRLVVDPKLRDAVAPAFRDKIVRDNLSMEIRLAAAKMYEGIANHPSNDANQTARDFNTDRARYLRGEIDAIPLRGVGYKKSV